MPDTKDGGYAWFILAGSFTINFIFMGILKTFGILYAELLSTYDTNTGSAAFIGSLMMFITAVIGPLAGFISTLYSFRLVSFIGGAIGALGLCLSSLVSNSQMYFLTYSTIIGVGSGFAFTPAITIVNFYFEKKRALANGIVFGASGLSTLVFPFLYRVLFDNYGLQGGLLILGGIFLNTCVGATAYRQPKCFKVEYSKACVTSSKCSYTCKMISNHVINIVQTFKIIIRTPAYTLYSSAFALALLAYIGNFVVIPSHLLSRGFVHSTIVQVLMTTGGVELLSRTVPGLIIDRNYISAENVFILSIGINGVFCIMFPFITSASLIYVYCVLLGILLGSFPALMPVMLISVTGLERLPNAFALTTLLNHTACLLGVPLVGWMKHLTGNWNCSFYFLGSIQFLSVICVYIGRFYLQRTLKDSNEMKFARGNLKAEDRNPENESMLQSE